MQRAIAELAEGYGMAEVGLSVPASVGVLSGHDQRHGGEPFIDQLVLAFTCGPGGPVADGWLTLGGIGDAGVLQWSSIEIDELRFPIRIESHRIVPDSEGAGFRRGAPSASFEVTPTVGEFELMYLSDGTINPALGARGGGAGATAWQALRDDDGTSTSSICAPASGSGRERRSCAGVAAAAGTATRSIESRAASRRTCGEGIVTRQRAESVYGVVIDDARRGRCRGRTSAHARVPASGARQRIGGARMKAAVIREYGDASVFGSRMSPTRSRGPGRSWSTYARPRSTGATGVSAPGRWCRARSAGRASSSRRSR